MSHIPPFQPRCPLPTLEITTRKWKSIRRIKIFPNYRIHLPTLNGPCARLRLWRKDLAAREQQLKQLKSLKEDIDKLAEVASKTSTELQRVLFCQRAQVHQISISFGLVQEGSRSESPIPVHLPPRSTNAEPPSLTRTNVHIHPRYIATTHANPMYLELLSCPSSPVLAPSLLPTPTASPSYPSPSSPCITASDTASLHLGQIKDVMYSYFDGYCYTALRRSLKKRRPGIIRKH